MSSRYIAFPRLSLARILLIRPLFPELIKRQTPSLQGKPHDAIVGASLSALHVLAGVLKGETNYPRSGVKSSGQIGSRRSIPKLTSEG